MPWFPYVERYEADLADRRRVRVRQGSVDIKWQRIGRKKYPPDGEAMPGKVKRGIWVVTKKYKRIQHIDLWIERHIIV